MEVLSDAVPITNGEVYALLRRRRDERNAARHPPFGLQPALADSQQRAAVATGAAAAASIVPSAAASVSAVSGAASVLSSKSSKAVPAGAIESASAAAAASTTNLLASPSSRHLVVLLTEVTMLNYLANHSALLLEPTTPAPAGARVRTCTPRDLYGPTSVYNRAVGTWTAGSTVSRPGAVVGASKTSADALVDTEIVSSCYAKMAAHRPGTRGHVRGVSELLEHFEEAGRAQERFYAAGVRRTVQQLWRRRLWSPAGGPYPPSSLSSTAAAPVLSNGTALVKTEPVAEEDVAGTTEALQRSSLATEHLASSAAATTTASQDRVARRSAAEEANNSAEGARSTIVLRPLAPLLLEPTPLWGPAARCCGGKGSTDAGVATVGAEHSPLSYREQLQVQQASRSLLSEAEVLQLVVGRPQRALDVYRLLDDVDGRLHYSEEAVSAFVEALTAVFAE
ncbi:hypothetical protein GH5_08260 [Leishmania sp. Ghana 2012 LV757]|uniref:hypothetical protein n=1 Tax=Leishmania sp. Ghana 2012 LV757 TaxID=2803181 RepID=UPI001B418FDA|nr:hypothetical protein GH5_08260 [Leishmania sp. Ghana 2012 LV757]